MGKIIITGSGRAGSTFLVQLMTRLGFDTGIEPGKERERGYYRPDLRAGGEWGDGLVYGVTPADILRQKLDDGPRVLKSPAYAFALKGMIGDGLVDVDHILMPFRDLDIAAQSRLDVGLDWLIPPGLNGAAVPAQANVHAMAVGRTVEAAVLFEIPLTMLRFPLFVQDADYCYRQLSRVEPIDYDTFKPAFEALAQPEMIKWA